MFRIFNSFSKEVKYYLIMTALITFGTSLSGVFQNVFLWRLDKTYSLLANFGLYWSIAVIACFGCCAYFARKTSPMITMRLGILCYLIEYLFMLTFHQTLADHIVMLGFIYGLAMSLYYVGVHMAILDLTENAKRDQFLYIQGILFTAGGVIAPLVSGITISRMSGMAGYYTVFAYTCLFFFLAFFTSLKVKGRPVSPVSHLWDVLKNPSNEWKKMYTVMIADGIYGGAYGTFLVTMMTFKIAGNELKLSFFQILCQIVSVFAFYILAKISPQNKRVKLFSYGALGIFFCSILLSIFPTIPALLLFGLVTPIANSMISTTRDTMLYHSIECDPKHKQKSLDYIIVREIPLGVGRIIGIFIFLYLRSCMNLDKLLPVAFSIFPIIYVLMIPVLKAIWGNKKILESF